MYKGEIRMAKLKIGVLLSGCGLYDGAEIHESVLTLLAIDKAGAEWFCIAPNKNQHHIVNHTDGTEMKESRNVLVESARIARGNIKDLKSISPNDMDALILPGGFGTAKNFTNWAIKGPDGEIDADVKRLLIDMVHAKKPVGALCMSTTTLAKAYEGSDISPELTVGTTASKSIYDIVGIGAGIEKVGSKFIQKEADEICVDAKYKIVTSPCYLMDVGISQVAKGAEGVVNKLIDFCKK
jgi:enhancing lycopene biosynthesis protein 2